MSKNANLNAARNAKNDEFYTQLSDVEKELKHYKDFFKGKKVLCNCNDDKWSAFFKYFSINFEHLGLKQLVCVSYNENGHGMKYTYNGDLNGNRLVDDWEINVTELNGNGSFSSDECVELLKDCDVVVTNPPFSCYSNDTEVLTDNGWKFFKNVNISKDKIYSLNPNTNEIEIVRAIDFIKSPLKGDLLNFKSRFMDILVTDNHKMYTYHRTNNVTKYKGLVEAKELRKSDMVKIKGFSYNQKNKEFFVLPQTTQKEQYTRKEIEIPSKKIPMNDWLEFFGFYLADGCYRDRHNVNGNRDYTISIKQHIRNENYVLNLIKRIGFSATICDGSKEHTKNYCIYSKQLWEYLSQFGRSDTKHIPRDILNLGKDNLYSLYKGYVNGDSYKVNNGLVLSSKSKQLMSDFQEIILKIFGQIVVIRTVNCQYAEEPYTYYLIANCDTYHHNFSKYGVAEKIPYNDYVYCLTLEKNHIMLVKRNGKISWCGNCFRQYVKLLQEYDKKFLIIGNGNAVTYKEIFPYFKNNKMWFGVNNGGKKYEIPTIDNTKKYEEIDGKYYQSLGNTFWFTNIPHNKRNQPLDLYKKYNAEEFPRYDNYDAINVNKVCDIPMDYDGVIGVPITFLDKYYPTQFEIVDLINNGKINGRDLYMRIAIRRVEKINNE